MNYRFRYQHGQSMPFKTLEATDDADFFDQVLPTWERTTGFKHVAGTITAFQVESRTVKEPA